MIALRVLFPAIALLRFHAGCSDPEPAREDATSGGAGGAGTAGSGGVEVGGAGAAPDVCPPNLADDGPWPIGHDGGIDLMAAAFPDASGGARIVFETYDVAFTSASLWSIALASDGAVTPPDIVPVGDESMVSSPSAVAPGSAGRWLYFTATSSLAATLSVFRADASGDVFGPRAPVGPIDGVVRLQSFPRFHPLDDGRVAVAFLDEAGRPSYASSDDGLRFSPAVALAASAKAIARVGSFADGSLAFTYQTGKTPQVVTVQRSIDGVTWTDPVPVTDASMNVHDATSLRRRDGGLDIYYIYPAEAFGFSIFRRALAADGLLGAEERVTDEASGDATKPNVFRLSDCRVLLAYAEITERDAAGQPIEQRLGARLLAADAPPASP